MKCVLRVFSTLAAVKRTGEDVSRVTACMNDAGGSDYTVGGVGTRVCAPMKDRCECQDVCVLGYLAAFSLGLYWNLRKPVFCCSVEGMRLLTHAVITDGHSRNERKGRNGWIFRARNEI